jgi:hypothetical protein
MEIDPHNLPSEVNVLQQIVLQLLQAVEDKDQLLARVQHQLAQLLRYRYGQKRERIDESQLFLFAAQIIAASQRASAALSSEKPTADSSPRADRHEKKEKSERRGHGRRPLPESLERRAAEALLQQAGIGYTLPACAWGKGTGSVPTHPIMIPGGFPFLP